MRRDAKTVGFWKIFHQCKNVRQHQLQQCAEPIFDESYGLGSRDEKAFLVVVKAWHVDYILGGGQII